MEKPGRPNVPGRPCKNKTCTNAKLGGVLDACSCQAKRKKVSTYWTRLGNATSQWFNALAGGNPDVPISARVGVYSKRGCWWFSVIEAIIDCSFYPADGNGHCWNAYLDDPKEGVSKGPFASLVAVSVFAVLGSVIAGVIMWAIYLFKRLLKAKQ